MFGFLKNRRRKQLLAEPLPDEWREIIDRNVAIYPLLSPAEQQRLLDAIKIITDERSFAGVGGFEITDEVAVTIAAQAGLLLLGGDDYFFDRVLTILVHATHAHIRLSHPLGGAELVEEGVAIAGQLLEQGEVRLAWDEVLDSGLDPADGYNIVLHEFAHHLDWLDGGVDGTPPLVGAAQYSRWVEVLDREVDQLRHDLRAGRETFLPDHAAHNPGELFAYATEHFFEQPHDLHEFHPDLFDCLLSFYKTDPRLWFPNDGEIERRRDGEA
jgi:Mlc titration factor MtfA (ptsG expression regulator)